MQTYRLKTNHKSPAHFVIFKHGKTTDRIIKLFVENTTTPNDIRFPLIGEIQDGVTFERLQTLDFCEGFCGIALFSNKFMVAMQNHLQQELLFYPCQIICEGKPTAFNMGFINKRLSLVNCEKSDLNRTQLFVPLTFYANIDAPFLIARDLVVNHAYVVSEQAKQLIKKAKLNVAFEAVYLGPTTQDIK